MWYPNAGWNCYKQTHLFCFTVQKKYILNIKWSNLWLLNVEVYYFPLMDSRLKSVLNSTVGILIVQVVNTFDLLSSSNCQDVDMLVSFYLVCMIVNLRRTYIFKIVCSFTQLGRVKLHTWHLWRPNTLNFS